MWRKSREETLSLTDSDSDHSLFNQAFQSSSGAGISETSNSLSTNFTSIEAIHSIDTDESDLRRIIENDSFDSSQFCRISEPSLIIAGGNTKGSTANSSIETLQSTIVSGAMDSDLSFFSPNETLTNSNLGQNILDKRLSSEEEFKDCLSSPQTSVFITPSTVSTKYKSLRAVFSPISRIENNNNITKENDKSSDARFSGNSDSGIASNAASNSLSPFPDLPRCIQHLTTILEESTAQSNCNDSKRISGVNLMNIIETLRRGPMPNLPKTAQFDETMSTIAKVLDKSSKELTVDQLAQVIFYTLQTEHSYSDNLDESESFQSFREASRLSEVDSDNTGKELDSIIKQLRSMYTPGKKNIESESSPDWPPSVASSILKTPKNIFGASKMNQRPSSSYREKEFFTLPPSPDVESNKENLHSQQRFRHKETAAPSSRKSKVRFASDMCQTSKLNRDIQKKKYFGTPYSKRKEEGARAYKIDDTAEEDDSFVLLEQMCIIKEKLLRNNLRRSLSMPDVVTEESATSEVFKIDLREEKQKLQKTPRYVDGKQEKVRKYKKRRSRSVENRNHISVQTNIAYNNEFARNKINPPSTSGVQGKRPSQQKVRNCIPKLIVTSSHLSDEGSPTLNQLRQRTVDKNPSQRKKTPNKSSRKSFGIDNSHIPAVSQLRRIFSPASKALGTPSQPLSVPRIEITASSPERSINPSPTPGLSSFRKKNLSKSKERNSPRKPWRP